MSQIPTREVSELSLSDIELAFHLIRGGNTDWTLYQAPFQISEISSSYLRALDASIFNKDGIHEIALRQRLATLLTMVYSVPPKDPRFHSLIKISISGKRRFSFYPVIYEGEMTCLQGIPDYSTWYDPEGWEEYLAMNFFVVETKTGQSGQSVPQGLAYMAMIHAQRRYEGMTVHAVFGLSTDNSQFNFLQINTSGEWSQITLEYSTHRQEIVETLAYIHRHASILSTFACGCGSQDKPSEAQVGGGFLATGGLHARAPQDIAWSTLQIEDPFKDL
ncbi:hypothetical protein N7466_006973 [Penicillium verhagenii]|uniref:uncharacterized protein n=1 Tax=Penicillium verhagenii TaxID=1562060 RepID=UPI00254523EA|nr:uncharacterized protein N7466_006973 [Penicillium verhagenii]KAJ5928017.1 hypothetical protein N7466_006973 [Penicillium verhagenii]